jgi:hypothetical protein
MLRQANVNALVLLSYKWQHNAIVEQHPELQNAYRRGAHHFRRAAEFAERGY